MRQQIACALCAATLPAIALPTGALAQTSSLAAFPISDASVRVGDLRSVVGSLLAPNQNTPQGFTFVPSISVQELATDNVLQAAHPRTADVATFITPAILVNGETRLIQANISYAPSFQYYAKTSAQDQVAQNFNGSVLLTAVPDTLFLSLRGYGAQQSTSANAGQSNSPILSNQNRTQTLGFSASPYVTHRFGGDGTLNAGFVHSYSQQTGSAAYGPNNLPTINSQNALLINQNPLLNNGLGQTFGNATTRTNEEYATFTTGENLGRFNDRLSLDASQTTGSGVLINSRTSTAINSVGYGLTRVVSLIGSFGYEDISYAGIPPVHIRDAVYTGGIRLTPNQNSSASLTYGHKDGFNSATFNSSYQVTARMRVFAGYSEGLTTSQQEIQDNLANSTVDQYGNSIDNVTGAPVLINDQLLGLQSGLYRLRRFASSAVLTYDLDQFSLNVLSENRTIISTSQGQAAFGDKGTSATLTWTRQFSPALTGTASAQYGLTTTQTVPSTTQKFASLTLQTGYALSETLSATTQYYVNDLSSNIPGQSTLQNVFLVGLRKTF